MLDGYRILVVEDEFLLAEDMRYELEDAGAIVLGPEPSVALGLARIAAEPRIDAAVLDVNLGGERVFPIADALAAKQVPFIFVSGYEDMVVRDRYPNVTKCDKPINTRRVVEALDRLIASGRA